MKIQKYESKHYQEIADLFHDTVHLVCNTDYTQEQLDAWAPTPINYKKWKLRCEEKNPFIVIKKNKIIGFGELEKDGHIDCFYIHKNHQRQGVGRLLLEYINTLAIQQGLKKLYAEVSITAKAFFEKQGFEIIRKNIVQINNQELINFTMGKNIKDEKKKRTTYTPNPHIILRPATLTDLPLLKHWDEQDHVVASDPNDDWGWEIELTKNPEWREQLIAELKGRPIGFIQIIDPTLEDSHYWGKVPKNLRAIDIWIGEKEDLGKGYGTQMMRQAINRCFADSKITAILIDPLFSNKRAIKFYERFGFKFVERRKFGEDDCAVHELQREEWIKLKI